MSDSEQTRQGPADDPTQTIEVVHTPEDASFQQTQSIHLDSLFSQDVTSTGSFSFTGLDQTWFGKMIQALPIPALLVDQSANIIFMNTSWSRVSPEYEGMTGKPLSSLFANVWIAKEAESLTQKVLAARQPEFTQGVVQIGDTRIWGRLHFRAVRVGTNKSILVLIEDLTAEKQQLVLKQQHEEQILKERSDLEKRVERRTAELADFNKQLRKEIADRKRAEERYRMLVENAPVGIISCDTKGKIIEHNPAVTEVLGSPSAEATAQLNLLTFSSPDEARVSATIRKCLETGESIVNEFPYRSPWGKQIYAVIRAVPVRGNGSRIVGVQAVIEDVSDQKWAEGIHLRSERLKALVKMAGGMAEGFLTSLKATADDAEKALACLESGDVSSAAPLLERIHRDTNEAVQIVSQVRQFADVQPRADGLQTAALDLSDAAAGETAVFRILLINDSQSDLKKMEQGLRELRQTTFAASSCEQALGILQTTQVDSVICDLLVEEADGWTVSSQIQALCGERGMDKPPIVMLTPPSYPVAEEELLAHPYVDRVVEKPVKLSRLLEIIGEEVKGAATSDAFSGRIHAIDILEYIQLVLLTKQQAVLEIRSRDGTIGFLYVDRGRILHAMCGTLVGEEAFHRCVKFRAGSFASLPWREPDQVTIDKPGELLLFEAARMRDHTPRHQPDTLQPHGKERQP
jgi:PAS domain S-box-containing protein